MGKTKKSKFWITELDERHPVCFSLLRRLGIEMLGSASVDYWLHGVSGVIVAIAWIAILLEQSTTLVESKEA